MTAPDPPSPKAPAMTDNIAAGLSEAQRRAIETAEPTFGGKMRVWAPHRGTMNGLHARGLCTAPDYRDLADLTATGIAVRNHIKETEHGQ